MFLNHSNLNRLDPTDRQAIAGLMAMGRSTNTTIENSYTTSSVTEEGKMLSVFEYVSTI